MAGFFIFLWRIRLFLVFIGLEVLCGWLLVTHNSYQSGIWLSTSNEMVASTLQTTNAVRDYFNLQTINASLADENARLNRELALLRQRSERNYLDTAHIELGLPKDTGKVEKPVKPQYNFIMAKVINNSVSRQQNYITLNRGRADGIEKGMGVIAPDGVVGLIRQVSENYSVATSLLHTKMQSSAAIKRNNAFGTIRWNGADPTTVQLDYIAYNVKLKVGDTVQTSALSPIFPPGIVMGKVSRIGSGSSGSFYDIDVKLRTNFNALTYVYVVQNLFKAEQDSLQAKVDPKINE